MSAENFNCINRRFSSNTNSQLKYYALLILMLSVQLATAQKIGLPVFSFADTSSLKLTDNKQGNNYYTFFEVEMKAGNGILVEMESSYFISYIQLQLGDSLYGKPKNWEALGKYYSVLSYVAKQDMMLRVVLFSATENKTGTFKYCYRLFDNNHLSINNATSEIMRMYSLINHWLLDWHFVTDKTGLDSLSTEKLLNKPFDFSTKMYTYKKNNSATVRLNGRGGFKEVLFSVKNLAEANKVKEYYYNTKKIFENYFDTSYWKIEFRSEQKITGSNDFSGKKAFSDYITSSLIMTLKEEYAAGFYYPGMKPLFGKRLVLDLIISTEPGLKDYADPAVRLLLY